MLTVKQITDIISAEFNQANGPGSYEGNWTENAAEKIVAASPDYDAILVSSAALENEVTSTLMDMVAATVLATLIKEEGGGRSNITYSPETMANMTRHFDIIATHEGLLRKVVISMKPGMRDAFFDDEPATGPSVMTQDESTEDAKPQAEEHVYDRPLWVVAYQSENDQGERQLRFLRCHDRADAERQCRECKPDWLPRIENRHCLHTECPASGCTRSEATSEG